MARPLFLLVLASILLSPPLAAAEKAAAPADDATVLHLTEQAQRMVPRDRLRAVLRIDSTDADAATLQAAINRRMQAAVARAKTVAGISLSTGGYFVYQERPEGEPPRWHGSASLTLVSRDAAPLLILIGGLQQDGLAISGLTYELTPEAVRSAEDALTAEALTRLKERGQRIADDLGMAVGRLRDVRVGNATGEAPVPHILARSKVSPAATPVAQPGEAAVTVTVSAEIELVAKR